jgi:chaperone modulatory protein CbpM
MTHDDDHAVWLHERTSVTIVELERTSGLPRDLLRDLVDMGALEPLDASAAEWKFAADCVARLRRGAQLYRDLELETSALALALSFMERIEELEERLRALDAQLPRPPQRR